MRSGCPPPPAQGQGCCPPDSIISTGIIYFSNCVAYLYHLMIVYVALAHITQRSHKPVQTNKSGFPNWSLSGLTIFSIASYVL